MPHTLRLAVAAALLALASPGCATDRLAYPADPPIGGLGDLSADYTRLADKLLVELNTEGLRIDQVWIAGADGAEIKPTQIEYQTGRRGGVGLGVGVGTGGGGVGVGVGTGTEVGGHSAITGNTKLYFDPAAIGDAPWTMHLKLIGYPRTTITMTPKAE